MKAHNTNDFKFKKPAFMPKRSVTPDSILAAVELVRSGGSYDEATAETGVPRGTINRHKHAKELSDISHYGRAPLIDSQVEPLLEAYLLYRASVATSATREDATCAVNEILLTLGKREKPVRLGSKWFKKWDAEHPWLTLHKRTPLSKSRAQHTNPEAMKAYFNLIDKVVKEKKIKSFWNTDETGVNGAAHQNKARAYNLKGAQNTYSLQSANREHATLIGGIGVAPGVGCYIAPPVVLMKGKGCRVYSDILDGAPTGSKVGYTENVSIHVI
jgi:hypothetical protein